MAATKHKKWRQTRRGMNDQLQRSDDWETIWTGADEEIRDKWLNDNREQVQVCVEAADGGKI